MLIIAVKILSSTNFSSIWCFLYTCMTSISFEINNIILGIEIIYSYVSGKFFFCINTLRTLNIINYDFHKKGVVSLKNWVFLRKFVLCSETKRWN